MKIKLLVILVFIVISSILYINYSNAYAMNIIANAGFTTFSPIGITRAIMMQLSVIFGLGVIVSIFISNKYFNLVFYALNTALELFVFIKVWFVLSMFYTGIFYRDFREVVILILVFILLFTTRMLFNIDRIKKSLIEWGFLFISSSIYGLIMAYEFLLDEGIV